MLVYFGKFTVWFVLIDNFIYLIFFFSSISLKIFSKWIFSNF